jgi:hypothetical protein
VDAGARADEAPAVALVGSGVAKTREPLDRHGEGAAVLQVDDEGVWDELDGPCPGFRRAKALLKNNWHERPWRC